MPDGNNIILESEFTGKVKMILPGRRGGIISERIWFLVALSLARSLARAGPMRASSAAQLQRDDHCAAEWREGRGREGHCSELLSDFAIPVAAVDVVVSLSTAFLLLSPSLHTFFSPPRHMYRVHREHCWQVWQIWKYGICCWLKPIAFQDKLPV